MINETLKQRRRADELSQTWDAYFPSVPIGVEYWMATLDEMPTVVLTRAIKHLARKRVQLRGNMTLEQMLTYLQSSCVLSLKQDIASGIYKADQFPSLICLTTPQVGKSVNATSTATTTVTEEEEPSWNR
jgi:hypothetical protein